MQLIHLIIFSICLLNGSPTKNKEGVAVFENNAMTEGHRIYSVYFNGVETLEIQENQADVVLEKRINYLATLVKPYVEFYFNKNTLESIKLRKNSTGEWMRIEKTEEVEDWKLLSDTMTINGYKCLKAERYSTKWNYDLVVWYCPYLGIQANPLDYKDLPGLVISSNQLKLKSLTLKELGVLRPNKGTLVSEKEYQKEMEKVRKQLGVLKPTY